MYMNAPVYEDKILQLSVPLYIVFSGILWFSLPRAISENTSIHILLVYSSGAYLIRMQK
jgi:hypothetical protein